MPLYETVFIARQDLTPGQNEELTNQMSQFVTNNGGKITQTEYWGLRQMAYRIKKNRKGHYVMIEMDAPAAAKDELERNLRLHEDVLRFMTVRIETLAEGPSAMMRKDSESNSNYRRDDRQDTRQGEAA
jgi:small subunit ribosomal protein S6